MGKKVSSKKKKSYLDDKNNQKKITVFIGIVILVTAILMAFNNGEGQILKSEYKIGEAGYIDDIELTLTDAVYINNNSGIEVSFKITNKRDNTITIIPDDYFVFYDINQVQIPNKFKNDKNIIKKDETITYKLQYDVTQKELYEIYFYSQVVENNAKFSFTSSDIKSDNITESNIAEEELKHNDENLEVYE